MREEKQTGPNMGCRESSYSLVEGVNIRGCLLLINSYVDGG